MISVPDMAIIGALALMLFGPEQLPKVARKVGHVMRDIQNTSQAFIREMERAADEYEPEGAVPHYDPYLYEPPRSVRPNPRPRLTRHGKRSPGHLQTARLPGMPGRPPSRSTGSNSRRLPPYIPASRRQSEITPRT